MAANIASRIPAALTSPVEGMIEMGLSRKQHIEAHEIINALQALETRAHAAGLTVMGHAINNAKNAAGWELAGDVVMAGKASRGERAGESKI